MKNFNSQFSILNSQFSILKSSLKSLLQHKLRSLLSTLGIVFAVAAVIAMLAIAEGAKRETLEQISQLGTDNIIIRPSLLTDAHKIKAQEKLSSGLTFADAVAIQRRLSGVLFIAPLKEVRARVSIAAEDNVFDILAVTRQYSYVKHLSMKQGRFICDEDMAHNNLVAVLGSDTADLLGNNGKIGEILYLENLPYKIVGILNQRQFIKGKTPVLSARDFNHAIFIPYGTEPKIRKNSNIADIGEISEIFIKIMPGKNMTHYARAIERILLYNHSEFKDFQIVVPEELIYQAQKTQQIFNIVLGCIAGISLLVGGIGIMNIMIASVTERTREIGIRRAIGASRGDIILQFLTESVMLTFIGGFIGMFIGGIGVLIIANFAGWHTAMTFWSVALALFMSLSVGIFFGLYPAYKAAMLDPIFALRHE